MFALIAEGSDPVRLSLKCDPQLSKLVRDKYETVLPGYHLNKKHWNTIICSGQLQKEELKDLINEPRSKNEVLKNMSRYLANIPGTASYWHDANKDLDSIIKTKGGPTAFFTFTYANNYDPVLHDLLLIPKGSSLKYIKNVGTNKQYRPRLCSICDFERR
jgi:hypothetical protein